MPRLPRRTVLPASIAAAALAAVAAVAAPAIATSGPDVSAWQHPQSAPIDWQKVAAAGNDFVFIKAAEGRNYVNPWWAGDREGAMAAGLAVGAYDFADPGSVAAVTEARHFSSVIGPQTGRGELPPVLDLEQTGGLHPTRLINWVGTWLRTTRRLTHRTPIIYTSPSFWAAYLRNTRHYSHYPLWVANWGVSRPRMFGGWTHWLFWQFTSTARVAGVKGRIDEDRYAGTPVQFRALAHLGPVPAPGSGGGNPSPTGSPAPSGSPTPTGSPIQVTGAAGRSAAKRRWTRMHLWAPSRAGAAAPVRLSGALTTYGGRGVPKSRVIVQARGGDGKWHPLSATRTVWDGHFRGAFRATRTRQLRALFPGTHRLRRAVSPVRTVQVP